MATLSVEELRRRSGDELGVSDWTAVTQDDVTAFADATGDHNWIHVDAERARATPFEGTIAHGFFTLSLAARLLPEVLEVGETALSLNYGLDRVRFVAPLLVGDDVRLRVRLADVDTADSWATLALDLTFEARSTGQPVCVARWLVREYLVEPA